MKVISTVQKTLVLPGGIIGNTSYCAGTVTAHWVGARLCKRTSPSSVTGCVILGKTFDVSGAQFLFSFSLVQCEKKHLYFLRLLCEFKEQNSQYSINELYYYTYQQIFYIYLYVCGDLLLICVCIHI